jgi:glycosyltransferase involved in cell wall biosynthesis
MKHSGEHFHLISFDVPFPADYGGVIDVFYKIKALHELGVKIHLHAYHYGRNVAPQLEELCHKVYYYKRKTYKNPFISRVPYIVNSRNDDNLLRNLLYDDHPIIFEGLHTTYHLSDKLLRRRLKIVRMHNIEHHYYAKLEEAEKNFFKKYFFKTESEKLRTYERVLNQAQLIAAISPADFAYFFKKFKSVFYLPVFHSNHQVILTEKSEPYVLYHGNLAVGENDVAALFLLREVFNDMPDIKLIIAGNNPSTELLNQVQGRNNVELISSVSTSHIDQLISMAHINLLPTFQDTGIKLKLINALYKGKFCVVNSMMVKGTGLEKLCIIKDKPEQIKNEIRRLLTQMFDLNQIAKRKELLEGNFCNKKNAALLVAEIAKLKT